MTWSIEVQLEKSQKLVADLNDSVRFLKEELKTIEEQNKKFVQMGQDFETMMKAVNSNPTVADAWKKFMVALRICGYDSK